MDHRPLLEESVPLYNGSIELDAQGYLKPSPSSMVVGLGFENIQSFEPAFGHQYNLVYVRLTMEMDSVYKLPTFRFRCFKYRNPHFRPFYRSSSVAETGVHSASLILRN
jgi:hypothetical protein